MLQPVEFVEMLVFGSIHAAAHRGDLVKIEKLLNIDPRLLKASFHAMTPLHYACDGRHEATIRYLLNKGANPNALDAQGRSPLHYAVMRCHLEGAALLLGFGANPDPISNTSFMITRRKSGSTIMHKEMVRGTPMDVAIALRCMEISHLLRRYDGHRMDELYYDM
jgi:ankyrin repeat protein